jgi:hypothetical protein
MVAQSDCFTCPATRWLVSRGVFRARNDTSKRKCYLIVQPWARQTLGGRRLN